MSRLPSDQFVGVSRSAVVNLDQIARLEPWMGRRDYMIVLHSGVQVRLSRTHRRALESASDS